jgi:hypothetical protein
MKINFNTFLYSFFLFTFVLLAILFVNQGQNSKFLPGLALVARASEELIPSIDDSIILAAPPLEAKADGVGKIAVAVYVRDKKKRPVSKQQVTLSATNGAVANPNTVVTDDDGKAEFTITSTQIGKSEVTTTIVGTGVIPKNLSVEFLP